MAVAVSGAGVARHVIGLTKDRSPASKLRLVETARRPVIRQTRLLVPDDGCFRGDRQSAGLPLEAP